MMEASKKKMEELLRQLELSWSDSEDEGGFVLYNVVLDQENELELTAVLYGTEEDGYFLRLLAYVDELSVDEPLDQLTMLMKLNCELPAGTFCLNPVDSVVYATLNLQLEDLEPEDLDSAMNHVLDCQDYFFQEYYGDMDGGDDGGAQA
ncbi:MAG: type III secretion system chaperone [bacterium]